MSTADLSRPDVILDDHRPILADLFVADAPGVWRDLGFDVVDDSCHIGSTTIRFVDVAEGSGIVGWSFRGIDGSSLDGSSLDGISLDGSSLDGISTRTPVEPVHIDRPAPANRTAHTNRSVLIDHVVVMTPDMGRTNRVFEAVGLDCRRVRDVPGTDPLRQQGFYRLGEVVLEVVGTAAPTGQGPASLWGLVTVVDDIDETARVLGDHLGPPKDAVQPGRRIATVRRTAGLAVPLAFITPDPKYHASLGGS